MGSQARQELFKQFKEQIYSAIIIDPSILIIKKFWSLNLEIFQSFDLFYPKHLENIAEEYYIDIYGCIERNQIY